MFHRFHAGEGTAGQPQGALTPDEFEDVLLYVGIENILSPPEWISRLKSGDLREHDLCITFDDGLRCQREYALPVLERYGLQAFWFVYSCVLEGIPVASEVHGYVAGRVGGMEELIVKFLGLCPDDLLDQLDSEEFASYECRMRDVAPFYTSNDIKFRFLRNNPETKERFDRLMDRIISESDVVLDGLVDHLWLSNLDLKILTEKGQYIGLHSYDHPYEMSRMNYEEQHQQYEKNYAHIYGITGKEIEAMSHPLGSYSEETMVVLRELGIACGFRAEMAPPLVSHTNSAHLELPREDSTNLVEFVKGACPEGLIAQ